MLEPRATICTLIRRCRSRWHIECPESWQHRKTSWFPTTSEGNLACTYSDPEHLDDLAVSRIQRHRRLHCGSLPTLPCVAGNRNQHGFCPWTGTTNPCRGAGHASNVLCYRTLLS